jgi:hypothetical protein
MRAVVQEWAQIRVLGGDMWPSFVIRLLFHGRIISQNGGSV